MKPALNHVKYVRFFSNGLESSKSCLWCPIFPLEE
jgi:hypothetical protein